ncbi:NRAMP family divalent metal transporter [Paraburkholderia sp.]|uniref:NRAMP family divalent metal transporter n=1 Tax=Paraburkholderia sp. TaxID=1926495 RepID=UPI002F414D20
MLPASEVGQEMKGPDEIPARSWAADLGPGLASVATDNDPSGIVTYSLAGAQFGYDMLWACVLSYPSMVAFQLVAARIAILTGKGLTANMREHYSRFLFYLAVARFLIANTFNIAADVLAMGVAAEFLWHGPVALFTVVGGFLSLALQWFVPYARYAQVLKWLTAILFAYVGVAVMLDLPWRIIALRSLVPHITWTTGYFTMLLAVFGTTISPYLLYSQAQQQVEELREERGGPSGQDRARRQHRLQKMRKDTLVRTAFSNVVGFFIICAAAATLHATQYRLHDSFDAARVIEPLAHGFAAPALGLAFLGTALLALPPLAGSAAQAAASAFEPRAGDEGNRTIALALVVVMTLGIMTGVSLAFMQIEPVRVLYWGAVINGSTATPVMVLLVLLSTKHAAVGDLSAHWTLRALCWLATSCMGAALLAEFACRWLS